jgi:hypothetical protein
MTTSYRYNIMPLILLTVIATVGLTACSKQNWYQGGQSSLQAKCMKGPAAEYNDCMKQASESYNEYEKSRETLLKDPQPDN